MFSYLKRNTLLSYTAHSIGAPLAAGLAYHGSTADTKRGLDNVWGKHIDAAKFESHLQFLDRHYRVVPIMDVIEALRNGKELPRRSVFITFDDGYKGNYEVAFPLLRKYGMKAAFFVMTAYAGTAKLFPLDIIDAALKHTSQTEVTVQVKEQTERIDLAHDIAKSAIRLHVIFKDVELDKQADWLEAFVKALGFGSVEEVPPLGEHAQFMNWAELAEMKAAGMEIGSHTQRHAIMGRVPPGIAKEELLKSKQTIENNLGSACRVFCYPNGGYPRDGNEQTNRMIEEAGYLGCTYMGQGMNTRSTNPYFMIRNCIGQTTRLSDLQIVLSGTVIRAKRILGRDPSPQAISNRKQT